MYYKARAVSHLQSSRSADNDNDDDEDDDDDDEDDDDRSEWPMISELP